MNLTELIFLAIALSIDATVVSFSQGLIFKEHKRKTSLILAFFLGFFQFFMPIIGYFFALGIYDYLEFIKDWIIFAIFLILGIKFIKEAFEPKEEKICCLGLTCILGFAIATSIDALGAGVSLGLAHEKIWFPALLIGVITFINSLIGFWSGYLFKKFPSRYLEIIGGIILILLAFSTIF